MGRDLLFFNILIFYYVQRLLLTHKKGIYSTDIRVKGFPMGKVVLHLNDPKYYYSDSKLHITLYKKVFQNAIRVVIMLCHLY